MDAPTRREFLCASALAVGAAGAQEPKPDNRVKVPARAVTKGPEHHWFGYYDKSPWDATSRYLLAMEAEFCDRQPKPTDFITVGMVDLKNKDEWIPFTITTAWSWQQGCMLQWLGSKPTREVIFNSIAKEEPAAVVMDAIANKPVRVLPRPIYCISADGTQAMSLDFARLHRLRPGYGYASAKEQFADEAAPEKLGVWWMDTKTGKNDLVVNLKQLAALKPDERFQGAHHWVNHLLFNPGGTRFVFLHRWKKPDDRTWQTRMLTAKPDGADLRIAFDDGTVSHFDWRDDTTILAWARTKKDANKFYTVDVVTGETKVVGADVLTQDGHCSYSPDRKWILNDTYPDKDRKQWLMLF